MQYDETERAAIDKVIRDRRDMRRLFSAPIDPAVR